MLKNIVGIGFQGREVMTYFCSNFKNPLNSITNEVNNSNHDNS